MPLSPDAKQYFRRPLYDHSIDFDKAAWRDFATRPKNMTEDEGALRIDGFDNGPRKNLDISDDAIGDVLKLNQYDVYKSYEALGHVKRLGNTMNYGKMVSRAAVREEYNPLPSFMIR